MPLSPVPLMVRGPSALSRGDAICKMPTIRVDVGGRTFEYGDPAKARHAADQLDKLVKRYAAKAREMAYIADQLRLKADARSEAQRNYRRTKK